MRSAMVTGLRAKEVREAVRAPIPVESRQVKRATLRRLAFDGMHPHEKHNGKPLRAERRKLARAYAAQAWNRRQG